MGAGKKGFYGGLLGASMLLAACGGNGGGSGSGIASAPPPAPPPPAPPPPPPVNFDTAEFQRQFGLDDINALAAYDEGADGSGVIVSIIDTGIDVDNPEFAGRIHPDSADLVVNGVAGIDPADARPGSGDLQDEDDHGTPIASIIGAARDDVAVHGVAPESQLLIFRVDDNTNNEAGLLGAAISEGVERSAAIGAGVINMSFGSDDPSSRAAFRGVFEFTQSQDIVVAIAAGNTSPNGASEPDQSALGAVDVAGPATVIVVGAYNSFSNGIASFSDRAGEAQDIYLVAPGVQIPTTRVDTAVGATDPFSGTSAAAPHVAGAAALLRDLWPQLSAAEVVEILLDSATDLGAPGTDPIFGRGLLNVGAAVSPMGTVSVTSADGLSAAASSLQAQLSGPFGTASLSGLGDVVVFDSFNRNFTQSLDGAVSHSGPQRFDLTTAFDPFETRDYAVRRLSGRVTAQMQLTSSDRSLTDLSSNQAASFAGADVENDLNEDRLAFALTTDLGEGRRLSFAQGFAATTVDSQNQSLRRTPFLSQSAFTDAYLPEAEGALATMLQTPLSKNLHADLMIAHAYDFYTDAAPLLDIDAPVNPERQASVFRAGLNFTAGRALFRLEQGLLQEEGTVLGAFFEGDASASTVYGAVEGDWAFAPLWRMKGRYALGRTDADISGFGGLIDDFSGVLSSQFSFSLSRARLFGERDSLWLGVSQPLQVSAGTASLRLPTAYDPLADELTFTTTRASLASEGRQYDLEAGYRLFMGPLGAVDVNVVHQRFAENALPPATTVLLRSGFDF